MNNSPIVTVYIATYNRIRLLQRAIDSVLGQGYKNTELIIVDDYSSDGTSEYLAEVAKKYKHIRFFVNGENQGACFSRNLAIEAAKGEFITGLDDDDYFMPNRIQDFVNAWDDENGLIALYSHLTYKKSDSDDLIFTEKPSFTEKKDMLYGCQTGCQIFTKTVYLREAGGFDTNMPMWQDLECWYRLLSLGHARRVNNASYVVDISHPHERLSNQKTDKVLFACQYFAKKHHLNCRERNRLIYQTIRYTPNIFSYSMTATKALFTLDYRLLLLSLRQIKRLLLSS